MSDEPGGPRGARPPGRDSGSGRREARWKFGAGAAIVACAAVFSLLVWAAFYLGFERMQADLVISKKTQLEAEPVITFDAEDQGWTLVRPANARLGTGPEYGNISAPIDAMCVFTWKTEQLDDPRILDAENDELATLTTLEDKGFETNDHGIVRLVSDSGQSLELVYTNKNTGSGLDKVVAARTFAGSGNYVDFTMKCERTGELNQELLQDTLLGVEIDFALGK